MTLWNRLTDWISPAPVPPQARIPAAQVRQLGPVTGSTLARPTYATTLSGFGVLPRRESFRLLEQFEQSIPALGRAIDILAGFVGVPVFEVAGSESATSELNEWAAQVAFGEIGQGLRSWIYDHLGQALLYGYGVGELELNEQRAEVIRLWNYRSPTFQFASDPDGRLQAIQWFGAQRNVLNPETALTTTYRPAGCDPNGRSLFFASITFCQAWLDIANAYRATWRRNGIPIYHIHYKPLPEEVTRDPDGSLMAEIESALGTNWNAVMKSQVMDGVAKDYYTAGGDITIRVIGADGAIMDVQLGKRAVVEEIVTATGIPAWMMGYSWSSTERLSTQQADVLTTTINALRGLVGGTLAKAVALRQRLAGKRAALTCELCWSDVNLQDLEATARAAAMDAAAELRRQTFWRQLWQDGVISQERYALELTGDAKVDSPMETPPAAATTVTPFPELRSLSSRAFQSLRGPALAEARGEYPELWERAGCNGRHG